MNNLPENYIYTQSDFMNWQHRMVAHINKILPNALPLEKNVPSHLHDAMQYAIAGQGKRFRPLLCYALGHCFHIDQLSLDVVACAIELIHIYSLIHDDLPAMDNDNMRRGRATLHIAYDEATAILVGDALQSQAYKVICQSILPSELKVKLIDELACAAGAEGMVGGQVIDLESVGKTLSQTQTEMMHKMKTGALLKSALKMAAFCTYNSKKRKEEKKEEEKESLGQFHKTLQQKSVKTISNNDLTNLNLEKSIQNDMTSQHMYALDCYAEKIGLAFQMADDALDVLGQDETLGKTAGKDAKNNKPTFVSLFGIDKTVYLAKQLCEEAKLAINCFGQHRYYLLSLADLIVKRCQ